MDRLWYDLSMITIDRKNKMAVDIALHIPLPSFKIRITSQDDTIAQNTELSYNRNADAAPVKTSASLTPDDSAQNKTGAMQAETKSAADGEAHGGKQ